MKDERRMTNDEGRTTKRQRRTTDDQHPSSIVGRPSSIELHIDELVLHGFGVVDRYAIAEAVQQELVRMLSEGETPFQAGVEIARLDGGAFDVTARAQPSSIGAQIARQVWRGLEPSA
ncbi:MAG: hypothetical protein LC737_00870 [Chloroflexi bacterium]|nr:hypothetical protein [Chloroflexota bacterium]